MMHVLNREEFVIGFFCDAVVALGGDISRQDVRDTLDASELAAQLLGDMSSVTSLQLTERFTDALEKIIVAHPEWRAGVDRWWRACVLVGWVKTRRKTRADALSDLMAAVGPHMMCRFTVEMPVSQATSPVRLLSAAKIQRAENG